MTESVTYNEDMPRTATEGRIEQIATAALREFTDRGFRRTQVNDIAKTAGVAQGTIYLYASSKEALFWLALQYALGRPISGPLEANDVLDQVEHGLGFEEWVPALIAAESGALCSPETVIGELYDAIEAYAPAVRLVESCTHDWPELADLFYGRRRTDLLRRLAAYLERAADAGCVRRPPDFLLAARLILETIAWFAMHRAGDFDGRRYDDTAARQATLDALVHAYAIPEP